MQELELTWSRFGRAFWFCFWRMTLFGFIGGASANFVLHWLLTMITGNPGPPAIGALVWIPISILVLRMALLKRYREFRIALVSTVGPDNQLPNCVLTSKDDASP